MPERTPDSTTKALVKRTVGELAATTIEVISAIPEEEIWLAGLKSEQTRRAYRRDVTHFVETLGIRSFEELRKVSHKHVIAWRRQMTEVEDLQNSTVRRRLSALSSLFTHLIERDPAVHQNPARDVNRPNINRMEGSTPAFSPEQAREMLDSPDPETVGGLRDRAILSVGFQAGLRRSEIAHLTVRDLHINAGFDSLRVRRKGGKKGSLAINPQAAQRIRAYLESAGHTEDLDGPLFRPLRNNGKVNRSMGPEVDARHMNPDAIDRVVRKYALRIGLTRDYSAHSMRATFITTALKNGAKFEDVQDAAGHANPSTTRLYDKRGYDPEKSASFFANY
ncbi:MAG: tyrosine-type recombinase/integrase [Phycisphaerales bacterium]|nr:tyrosine-type recombinase/integrase [Phycisphaerales bacterium]